MGFLPNDDTATLNIGGKDLLEMRYVNRLFASYGKSPRLQERRFHISAAESSRGVYIRLKDASDGKISPAGEAKTVNTDINRRF